MNLNRKIDTHPHQWAAGFFSLIWPGIGQLYNGQLTTALLIQVANNFWWMLFFGYLYLNLLRHQIDEMKFVLILFWAIAWIAHMGIIVHAFIGAPKAGARKLYQKWYICLASMMILAMVGHPLRMAVQHNLIKPYQVTSASMSPTILTGDWYLCDQIYYDKMHPRRGDIISFRIDKDYLCAHRNTMNVIKRIVGLPGETLQVVSGQVQINGQPIHEPYATYVSLQDNFGPYRIGPNQYFVMGDNRSNSTDSRIFGAIPRFQIDGKPMFITWSWDIDIPETQFLKRLTSIRWKRIGRFLK